MSATYDRIPRDWTGETAVIIAGGPSLTRAQVDAVRGKAKVVAINNGVYMAPWADVLWFADLHWFKWHERAVRDFSGEVWTLKLRHLRKEIGNIRILDVAGTDSDSCWTDDDDKVFTGQNSGFQTIVFAAKRGARRILLLGYDMRAIGGRVHWHDEHPVPSKPESYKAFLKHFPRLAKTLAAKGVEVINCTPGSALDAFPRMTLEDALAPRLHRLPRAS